MVAVAATTPSQRVSLTNLSNGEGYFAQFNPSQLEEQISVNYNRIAVPGLSHQPMQYTSTSNYTFDLVLFLRGKGSGIDFTNKQKDKKVVGLLGVQTFRRFLQSLCYPVQSTTVGGGGPPRVLVVWPNVLSLVCVVTGLKINSSRFNTTMAATEYIATVGFEEIRDTRLSMSEVRDLGSERSD